MISNHATESKIEFVQASSRVQQNCGKNIHVRLLNLTSDCSFIWSGLQIGHSLFSCYFTGMTKLIVFDITKAEHSYRVNIPMRRKYGLAQQNFFFKYDPLGAQKQKEIRLNPFRYRIWLPKFFSPGYWTQSYYQ